MKYFYLKIILFTWLISTHEVEYDNEFKFKAVCLSCKHDNDRLAARKLSWEHYRVAHERMTLDHKSIGAWKSNLKSIGCFVGNPVSGRPIEAINLYNIRKVLELINEDSEISTRKIERLTGISRSTIRRILDEFNFKTYKPTIVQKLYIGDNIKRKDFCKWILKKTDESPYFYRNIYFSDEAVFHVSGAINQHNAHVWATANPFKSQQRSNNPQRLIVWALIGYSGIVKFEILERTVNSDVYREILQKHVIPFFNKRGNSNLIFQQDGAPGHYSVVNRELLDLELPNRWIGRGAKLFQMPPRSPDLTVCDFFLWGYLKQRVYSHKIENLNDLRQTIIKELSEIPLDMIRRAVDNFYKRSQKCVEYGGMHFEMFMKKSN
uniref:Transposable element Tc3 transposase n=1 Tax=Strongyloides papillosus TaxID=174720 RepID=A0A0N5BGY5_STREA